MRQDANSHRLTLISIQHYTENFVQAIFDAIEPKGATLVIGGDGRYFSPETVQTILKIGSANGVAKFIVGKDTILSTPAASNIIRKYKAYGGILLTASHNPGGPDNDFGIKYNMSNGGPAPESVTNKIYEITKTIQKYKIIEAPEVSPSTIRICPHPEYRLSSSVRLICLRLETSPMVLPKSPSLTLSKTTLSFWKTSLTSPS